MATQTLRPYGLAVGIALLFFVVANAAFYFAFVRPKPPAPVAEAPPAAAPAVAVATTGVDLLADPAAWIVVAGEWQAGDGAVTAQAADKFDFAYVYQQPVEQTQLSVRVNHDQGIGGGLLFHVPDPSTARGAHMVRFYDDASIVWGYFDSEGVFQGQGSAPVPALGSGPHTLEVLVGDTLYTIRVDGAAVVEDVPVMAQGDYVGLTASQSAAVFTAMTANGAPAAPATTAETAAPALTPGKGDWVEQDGAIIQQSTESTDLYAGLGFQAPMYTAGTDVQWPEETEAPATGGGLLFNMVEPATLAGAQMARFSQNGREVFWGYFDEQGVFQGDGGAALDMNFDRPHALQVVVGASTFAVYVDGALVAENRPLRRQGGYVGLLTYRGPVTFTNIQFAAAGDK